MNLRDVQLYFRSCPPVDFKTFYLAIQLASDAAAGSMPSINKKHQQPDVGIAELGDTRLAFSLTDHPFNRAYTAIERLAANKERSPELAKQLASALFMRQTAFAFLLDKYRTHLMSYELVVEKGCDDMVHESVVRAAASLQLTGSGNYDLCQFFSAVSQELGRQVPAPSINVEANQKCEQGELDEAVKHLGELGLIKVHSQRTMTPYSRAVEDLLSNFFVARTIWAKADPATGAAMINEDELADEVEAWVESNALLTKEDLNCLKNVLRGEGYPKVVWQNIITEARGKRLNDLYELLHPENKD